MQTGNLPYTKIIFYPGGLNYRHESLQTHSKLSNEVGIFLQICVYISVIMTFLNRFRQDERGPAYEQALHVCRPEGCPR